MNDHPDLEKLDPSLREIVREVFRDSANGTPDNISSRGCWLLAREGSVVWNAWRSVFPAQYFENPLTHARNIRNQAVFDGGNCLENHPLRDFSNFDFGDSTCFKNIKNVADHTSFNASWFGDNCKFINVDFNNWIDFSAIKVDGSIRFSECTFKDCPEFIGSQISGSLSFNNVVFNSNSRFWGVQVGYELILSEVIFKGATSFKAMSWESLTDVYKNNHDSKWELVVKLGLDPCIFNRITVINCQFFGDVDFSGRTFLGKTEFISNGLGTKTKFNFSPPVFHQCQMHQDTSFDNVEFPVAVGSGKAARAYRTLKLSFSKQQAIREEQRFFRLEMAEEAAMAKGFQRYLYKAYSTTSDYGFSLIRPMGLLLIALIVAAAMYAALSYQANCTRLHCEFSSMWIEFSLLQALPLPGLDKLSEKLRDKLFADSGWTSIAVTLTVILHKTISLLALFLMGLGLRNLFKLK